MATWMPFRRVPVRVVDGSGTVVYSCRMTQRQWERWCHAARECLNAAHDVGQAALKAEVSAAELSDLRAGESGSC